MGYTSSECNYFFIPAFILPPSLGFAVRGSEGGFLSAVAERSATVALLRESTGDVGISALTRPILSRCPVILIR
jgi:hypothetical protein